MSVEPVHPLSGSFSPAGAAAWAGARFPPGAHVDGHAVTFAVYSRHATRVLLEIYEHPLGEPRRFDYWMAWGGDGWWRASIADVPVGTLYGFRCWGPNWDYADGWARGNSSAGFVCDVDAHGNRFNPNKLLFDPYARELSHDRETPAMKATGAARISGHGVATTKTASARTGSPDTAHAAPATTSAAGRSRSAKRSAMRMNGAFAVCAASTILTIPA